MSDHRPGGRLAAGALAALALSSGLLAGCGLVPSNRTTSSNPDPTAAASEPAPSGGGPSSTTPSSDAPSAPASTPAQTGRSVSAKNLLTLDDIYVDDPMTQEAVETPDGAGRPVSQSYICLPENGLSTLGATSMVTRDFTIKIINNENDPNPKSPLKNKPSVYTQALQFPDEATAAAARATYAGWIKNCSTTLSDRGYAIDAQQSLKIANLHVSGAKVQAGMVGYVEPGVKDTDHLYWESAGVTQVKDRLMITISITWGEDSPGGFDTSEGDASFINPQVLLTESGAERLKD